MNKCIIIGNVTHSPELRSTPSGVSVCSFTVAVNSRQKDKDGNAKTDFFRVSAWRQLADLCGKYIARGKKVAVIGEVSARAYEGEDGSVRAQLEANATEVEFLSPREDKPTDRYTPIEDEQRKAAEAWQDIDDDDLPFH